MNSEQIKKLAAAGLTIEQIAIVADLIAEVRTEKQAYSTGLNYPPGARGMGIETKVHHGEQTGWPEKKSSPPPHSPDPHPNSWGTENR